MQLLVVLHIPAPYFASREMGMREESVVFTSSTTSRCWQSLVQTWHKIPSVPRVLREGLKQTPDLSWISSKRALSRGKAPLKLPAKALLAPRDI